MTSSSPPADIAAQSAGADASHAAAAQRQAAPAQNQPDGLVIVAHNGAAIFGGAERALLRLLQGLHARGHRVTLCCNHDIVLDAALERGVAALKMPLHGDVMLGDAVRFARFLRRHRPDAVIFGTFKKIWLGGLAVALAPVPHTIARVGLASDTPRSAKYRFVLRRWIDTIVLNAEAMRADFIRGMPELDARIVVIHNGVPRPDVTASAQAVRSALAIPDGAVVVGAVARLATQKRLERLVEAVALLPDHVHGVIVGEGAERHAIEAATGHHGVSRRVHLVGHQENAGAYLAALDVFVVCSDQEGMSNAMLEALAAGVPVVSTPVSGAAEALGPLADGGYPGIITPGFAAADIADALRPLVLDAPLRMDMAAAATRAAGRFSLDHMIDAWDRLLRQGAA
ncbi:MAG: glycosyltransferase [Longimicrobiales bacterium]